MHKHRWLTALIWVFVLLILAGAAWFFFIYNTAAPAFLWQKIGNLYYDNGIYSAASTCYGKAIKNNPDCDTSLLYQASDSNKQCGNYTKAEYYLALAIQNYPQELESYLKLSALYVEEDKLLDASNFIDNCSSSVAGALESLRPAAPVIQPEETYNQDPITVTLSFSNGTAYISTDSEFPSIEDCRYESGLELDYGVTTVTALVVGENQLVSRVSSSEFMIRGEISELEISDSAMDETIRDAIGVGRYDDLTTDMLWDLEELTLPESVSDYSVLEHCLSLKKITISNNALDFSMLSKFSGLEYLDCCGVTLGSEQLEAIGTLSGLKELYLDSCALTDISALSGLSALTVFSLKDNQISDISSLSGLSELQYLDISGNSVTSLSALTSLTKLTYFYGSDCHFGNLGAFTANSSLQILDVTNCGVSDLTPLKNNTTLTALYAGQNAISFVDALEHCTSLETLDLNNNRIESISPLQGLSLLTYLNVSNNQLTELPSFSRLTGLLELDISDNAIESITVLKDLNQLHTLSLNGTLVTELGEIADLPCLVTINAERCEIHDPESATNRSIILNYDPRFELPKSEEDETEEE